LKFQSSLHSNQICISNKSEKWLKHRTVLWELGLAVKEKDPTDPTAKRFQAICKCKVDKDDPTITCNKKIGKILFNLNFIETNKGGAEKMSQEVRGQGKIQQGLRGLDGPVTPLKIKLDTYFKIPALPHAKLDVLAWWKVQEPVLPLLADIARKYLCIPALSAPSERLFSASGNVCTKLRSSLDPTNQSLFQFVSFRGIFKMFLNIKP